MPLVTTTEMFKKAYEGKYAIGAFNVNNMEIIQGIVDAAKEVQSPLILQVSARSKKICKKHLFNKISRSSYRGYKFTNCITFRPWRGL